MCRQHIWTPMNISIYMIIHSIGGIKKATSGSIFYGNACCAMWMFMKLAEKWPKLMQDWRSVEISMRRFGAPILGWKSTTLAIVLLVLAFSQFIIHIIICISVYVCEHVCVCVFSPIYLHLLTFTPINPRLFVYYFQFWV